MRILGTRAALVLGPALACLLMLTSCGGGNSGGPSATGSASAAAGSAPTAAEFSDRDRHSEPPVPITGVAATGAALAEAAITVLDSVGNQVGSATADRNGTFFVQPADTARAPFVLVAVTADITLVGMAADARTRHVNITPLTNLVASLLSSTGDPLHLATDIVANHDVLTRSSLERARHQVAGLLKPLTDALLLDHTDLFDAPFKTDGRGTDRLLDSLNISISPTGSSANIEITIKEYLADTAQPTTLSFTNTSPPSAPSYTVAAADLIPDGLSEEISALLERSNACYAQPLAARVSGNLIISPTCASLFFGDNPANYLQSGATVGPAGAYSGIFASAATDQVLSNATYLYSRTIARPGGGSITSPVIRYKALRTNGAISYSVVPLAREGHVLTFLGNQYRYAGAIEQYSVLHLFVNEPAANYITVGFVLNVGNAVATAGGVSTSIYDHVRVTAPDGTQYTLVPTTSTSYTVLVRPDGTVSGTDAILLSGSFLSAATTGLYGSPAALTAGQINLTPALTDAQIAQIPDFGGWQFQYFLAGNATPVPDATEFFRTERRPPTLAEFLIATNRLPSLVSPSVASLAAGSQGTAPNLYIPAPSTGPVTLSWTIPAGGQPVSIAEDFGYTSGVTGGWNDSVSPVVGATSASIACVTHTSADVHCANGNFAPGDRFTIFQLDPLDPLGGVITEKYNFSNLF